MEHRTDLLTNGEISFITVKVSAIFWDTSDCTAGETLHSIGGQHELKLETGKTYLILHSQFYFHTLFSWIYLCLFVTPFISPSFVHFSYIAEFVASFTEYIKSVLSW